MVEVVDAVGVLLKEEIIKVQPIAGPDFSRLICLKDDFLVVHDSLMQYSGDRSKPLPL